MIRGSCLCGAVQFELDGALEEMSNCHCSICRKTHGAAFSTYARAAAEKFRFTVGDEHVRAFRSSRQIERTFCDTCGSNLTFRFDEMADKVWIAVGAIDGDPGLRPEAHIFVSSKAVWHEITDSLPQYPEYPPHI